MKTLLLTVLCLSLPTIPAFATPSQIILIRHAEKPEQKSDDLSPIGFQRANAIPRLFQNRPGITLTLPIPSALFAAKFIPGPGGTSNRTIETLTPLSQELHLSIDSSVYRSDYQILVSRILSDANYDGKVVMIAWVHSEIIGLIKALGGNPNMQQWPDQVFDRVILLNFNRDGSVNLTNLPQRLLPGDSLN